MNTLTEIKNKFFAFGYIQSEKVVITPLDKALYFKPIISLIVFEDQTSQGSVICVLNKRARSTVTIKVTVVQSKEDW